MGEPFESGAADLGLLMGRRAGSPRDGLWEVPSAELQPLGNWAEGERQLEAAWQGGRPWKPGPRFHMSWPSVSLVSTSVTWSIVGAEKEHEQRKRSRASTVGSLGCASPPFSTVMLWGSRALAPAG